MASMDRFANVTDDKLDEAGRVCIICRDEMTVADCKQLPICNHLFHKSCLREWLVQQQSCPTCRSDIAAMEAQERARRTAEEAAAQRVQQDHDEAAEEGDGNEEEIVFERDQDAQAQRASPLEAAPTRRAAPQVAASSQTLPFPALYRISVPITGAAVHNDAMVVKRHIAYGTMVLCLGDANRHGHNLLEVPDGWIYENAAERLHAIDDPTASLTAT